MALTRFIKRQQSVATQEGESGFSEDGASGEESSEAGAFAIDGDRADLPRASVIVYTHTNTANLAKILPQLLAQKYAPGYEVIVVNDGKSTDTEELVERHRISHPNLRLTFAPEELHNISRKKLSLMLGIKSAHNPVAVTTTSDADIESEYWLASMMAPFADPSVAMVIGYSQPVRITDKGFKRTLTLDHVADAAPWLSAAKAGKPYRGSEYNLAYTRDVFFANKGFSRSLNLRHGDDDIYVSEVATAANTALVLTPESRVGIRSTDPSGLHHTLRRAHRFTEERTRHGRRTMFAFGIVFAVISISLAIIAAILPLPNLAPAAISTALIVTILVIIAGAWRGLIRTLTGRRMFWTIPALVFTYPLRRTMLALRNLRHRRRHYVWD